MGLKGPSSFGMIPCGGNKMELPGVALMGRGPFHTVVSLLPSLTAPSPLAVPLVASTSSEQWG